ncbi:MAG TPA: glycosyltransferase family 39 protein, partial [Aggregatilineales bacterium]|nr:glycosyltransferase family 39 protein [Aggregatilineales bacterium]
MTTQTPSAPSPLIRRLRRAAPVLALAVVLLAAGLRLHLLGAQSLWNDEGSSYVQATRTFSAIADNAARDIHPPGYYWMLAAWRALTGESEFALRALSAFASIMTVALTYAIGRRLMNPWAGVFAAALVALNTFAIYYAQEARMYALLALWAAGAVCALIGLLEACTP